VNFASKKPEEPELALNVIALTDVAFLIIIFFMFSTHFTRTQLRSMDLPQQAGETPAESGLPVIIEIDADGLLSLAGSGRSDLPTILAAAQGRASPTAPASQTLPDLVIRADRNTPALHLNELASQLSAAGIRGWKLATNSGG